MKNIHVLPTDKPSRLHNKNGELGNYPSTKLYIEDFKGNQHNSYQNIYITSDEEIKNDDWVYCPVLKKPVFICLDSILMFKNLGYDSNGNSKYKKEWLKKIILTTDPDLIKDGVQAIDDEFLEWFVKNPSCEEVEVGYGWIRLTETDNKGYWISISDKQFEMQQDEPKQETLEEVAHEMLVDYGIKSIGQSIGVLTVKKLMVNMAKWQAERMYSEEEVQIILSKLLFDLKHKGISNSVEWFEQFKKK